MRAVGEQVAEQLPDKRAHCMIAGLIARYCSVPEAYLAAAAKEGRDLIGTGDAEWSDWKADRAGIHCARGARNDVDLAQCCIAEGY